MPFIVKLSLSQRMALVDLIAENLRCHDKAIHSEQYLDMSTDPATVTTPGSLLRLLNDAKWKDEHGWETG